MNRLPEALRKILRLAALETIAFTQGVRLAERSPEYAIILAKRCLVYVEEALSLLSKLSTVIYDDCLAEACKELKTSSELFKSIITGALTSWALREARLSGEKAVYLLDEAHYHVHNSIRLINRSPHSKNHREIVNLLMKAREESSPTTLYRLTSEIMLSHKTNKAIKEEVQ